MSAAGGIEDDAALLEQPGRHQRCSARCCRSPEHFAVDGVAVHAEIEAETLLVRDRLRRLGPHHRADVLRRVEFAEFSHAGDGRFPIRAVRKPPQGAAQIDGERDSGNCQRMARRVPGNAENVIGDQQREQQRRTSKLSLTP